MKTLITCPFGLASLLAKEIKRLSIMPTETLDTAVLAETDWRGIYNINLRSRIANKCYLILGERRVETFDQLFDFVKSLGWKELLTSSDISLQVVTKASQLSAERTIQSVAHKAILTNVGTDLPSHGDLQIQILLHLEHDQLRVCLNTSGGSLHQRGWRKQTGSAPLKENLAAAIVLLSGWKFQAPLWDPFCGSGTLLIEAALIAKNIAPGLQRSFAFQQLKNYQAELREEVVRTAKEKQFQGTYQLFGSDKDEQVLAYAKENAERAEVADCISFTKAIFPESDLQTQRKDNIWLLTNPPYGKRLSSDEDLASLYHQLSIFWEEKTHFGGVITSFPFSAPDFSHKSLYN
ncbi:MAG: hypothetical protein LBD11_03965 [Candidatus Peribacteria bacterium]|nr:hypothetical protein [Candidatus Peribacteria bacterium]